VREQDQRRDVTNGHAASFLCRENVEDCAYIRNNERRAAGGTVASATGMTAAERITHGVGGGIRTTSRGRDGCFSNRHDGGGKHNAWRGRGITDDERAAALLLKQKG